MNTYNVYIGNIYRIIDEELVGEHYLDLEVKFHSKFSRSTILLDKGNGYFYDLITNRNLPGSCEFNTPIGTEVVDTKSLKDYNIEVNQTKKNMSKRKILKMYADHLVSNK